MKEYKVDENLVDSLKKDFGQNVELNNRLTLYADYVKLLKAGKKTTTTRFRRGIVRYPAPGNLPFLETRPSDKSYERHIGKICIDTIIVKKFGELDDSDAMRDGFSSKEELREKLKDIYGNIQDEELVSIYHIKSFQLDRGA